MVDYLVGLAAAHGHDPREVRDWHYRDLELFATVALSESTIPDWLG